MVLVKIADLKRLIILVVGNLEEEKCANMSVNVLFLCSLRVMMRLSKDRLRRLNKVWEQSEDGLTLLEFVKLMILEVPSLREEKLEMIHALIRLFKQVDINGDKLMQWSEFVQYIID